MDGETSASFSMSEAGQWALHDYVLGGGGVVLFGQNGFNYLSGKHAELESLIPVRSWWVDDAGWYRPVDEETWPTSTSGPKQNVPWPSVPPQNTKWPSVTQTINIDRPWHQPHTLVFSGGKYQHCPTVDPYPPLAFTALAKTAMHGLQ